MFSISKPAARMCPLLHLWLLLTWSIQGSDGAYNNEEFLSYWNERNFLVVWNIQSNFCNTKFRVNIPLDVEKHGIVQNRNGEFYGNATTIFYSFGKFPYISEGSDVNGGIPQLGDLEGHKKQVEDVVQNMIPNQDFNGLGVLDWETWRPVWETNWSPFRVYQSRSMALVKENHKDWDDKKVLAKAKEEFDTSARAFVESALSIAKTLRPNAFWGYYGFPACYNYETMQKVCSNGIIKSNDEIIWLYNTSTVLLPSIYIGKSLTSEEQAVYVYGILSEAMRVAEKVGGRPILPYVMPVYRSTTEFLREDDLYATIGQAAALGLPGIVLWSPYNTVNTPQGCKNLQDFINLALAPFVQKVRNTLQNNKPSYLTFPNDLPRKEWLRRIIDFYTDK